MPVNMYSFLDKVENFGQNLLTAPWTHCCAYIRLGGLHLKCAKNFSSCVKTGWCSLGNQSVGLKGLDIAFSNILRRIWRLHITRIDSVSDRVSTKTCVCFVILLHQCAHSRWSKSLRKYYYVRYLRLSKSSWILNK